MSFASELKKELCACALPDCCRRAEAYALFLYGHRFDGSAIVLQTESATVAQTAAALLAAETGVFVDVRTPLTQRSRGRICTVVVPDSQRSAVLRCFGHSAADVRREVRFANLAQPCCAAAFLRGAFLTCGTLNDPAHGYHLEFNAPNRPLADALAMVLQSALALNPGRTARKGASVIYFKNAADIAALLDAIGAPNRAEAVRAVRARNERRSDANRRTNFDTANIDKTVSAAAAQIEAILRVRNSPAGTQLPDELRALAALRLAHPEYSLRELGEALDPPVSRSGVNHRLTRLVQLAEKSDGRAG